MRISTMMILVATLCQLVFASTKWPNEPAGAQVLLDCPFNGSLCSGMWECIYKTGSCSVTRHTADGQVFAGGARFTGITLPGQQPATPPFVLDEELPAGSAYGATGEKGFALPNVNELYIGMWWSTNADYQGICNNNNKMFFIHGDPAAGGNAFFMWKMGPSHGTSGPFGWYWQTAYNNNGFVWPNVNVTNIAAGSGWHRLELYMKSSTTLTSNDGIIRWWVDGVLNGNLTRINLERNFNNFQYNHTWDGSTCFLPPNRDITKAWHHYWDDLHISIPNCGAAGCPIVSSNISTHKSETDASAKGALAMSVRATAGNLIFSFPQTANGSYQVSVFDLTGKKIREHKVGTAEQKEIHIGTALKNGVYFAKLAQDQKVSTLRFNVMN